jgi:hypothetical protein
MRAESWLFFSSISVQKKARAEQRDRVLLVLFSSAQFGTSIGERKRWKKVHLLFQRSGVGLRPRLA